MAETVIIYPNPNHSAYIYKKFGILAVNIWTAVIKQQIKCKKNLQFIYNL